MRFLNLSQLSDSLFSQYRDTVASAFPAVTQQSPVIRNYWDRIESYFPAHQLFAIQDDSDTLIGMINTIPLFWDKPIHNLPDDGWDWAVKKGIEDHEHHIPPNSVCGLQVIVAKAFLGQGYSKLIIAHAKILKSQFQYRNFFIPIRPTFKYKYPEMKMQDYLALKADDKIYDPWIRTHVQCGATLIRVCPNAMTIKGDLPFWENLLQQKITASGLYRIDGGLNEVLIDVEKNQGEYREENIWVAYL